MQDNHVNQIMDTTLEKIKKMVDVNTIIGDPILGVNGMIIVPVSKVSFGFFSGGGEYDLDTKKKSDQPCDLPFAGGAGAGVSLQPIGFIVAHEDHVTMLPVNYNSSMERLMSILPNTVSELKHAIKD